MLGCFKFTCSEFRVSEIPEDIQFLFQDLSLKYGNKELSSYPLEPLGNFLEHFFVHQSKNCCPWIHGLRPKKLLGSVTVPPTPARVPSQRPLAPSGVSVTLVANDKGENEIIPGLCTNLLVFSLRPGKP
jgi:hypothetical protein